jgi:hypothetical protein
MTTIVTVLAPLMAVQQWQNGVVLIMKRRGAMLN